MKRFILRFFVALGAFAAANVASFFALSDDLFTPDTPDALTRFGFPFLAWQDGGPLALCFFSRAAVCGNIAIAVAASFGAAACWPRIRREVLRTLGYETRIK
jgi:hypothetical protein